MSNWMKNRSLRYFANKKSRKKVTYIDTFYPLVRDIQFCELKIQSLDRQKGIDNSVEILELYKKQNDYTSLLYNKIGHTQQEIDSWDLHMDN